MHKQNDKIILFWQRFGVMALIFVAILSVCFYKISFDFFNKRGLEISIVAQEEHNENAIGHEISIRGVVVDGVWYDLEYLYSSGNWIFNQEEKTFTAINEESFILRVPIGNDIQLVFNYGPDQGIANIITKYSFSVVDCYNNESVWYGRGFNIEINQGDIEGLYKKNNILALICAVSFAILLLNLYNWYLKNKDLICWNIIEKLFLFILIPISFLFLYHFSLSSTPKIPEIANFWGYDGAFYTVIGKTCAQGGLPYVDIWEQKGPIIFLIYAVGYLISAHWGLYLLQSIAIYVSLLFSYFIGKNIENVFSGIVSSLSTLVFYVLVMDEGALIEDFNLPFLMMSVYFTIKYLNQKDKSTGFPCRYALIYGVTCGVSLGLRITNCVAVCGFVLCIFVFLLVKKQYKNILRNASYFILGFFAVVFPFLVFFGINNSLNDLLYGTILFSLKYTEGALSIIHSPDEWFRMLLYCSPAILCILFAFEQERFTGLSVSIAALSTIFLLTKLYLFTHYYIIILPFVPIAVSWILCKCEVPHLGRYTISYIIVALLFFSTLLPQIYNCATQSFWSIERAHEIQSESALVQKLKEQCNLIPVYDRDFVIGYNVRPEWYLINDITPCFKYYSGQDGSCAISNRFKQENIDFYNSSYAKWIVVQGDVLQNDIKEIISKKYTLYNVVYIQEYETNLNLYKIKE